MTDEEKRDYLDVLFDRDVVPRNESCVRGTCEALNALLKDSVFASLSAYKLELTSKAKLKASLKQA